MARSLIENQDYQKSYARALRALKAEYPEEFARAFRRVCKREGVPSKRLEHGLHLKMFQRALHELRIRKEKRFAVLFHEQKHLDGLTHIHKAGEHGHR